MERPESYVERRTDGFQVERMNRQASSSIEQHSRSHHGRSGIVTHPSAAENSFLPSHRKKHA